MINKEDEEVRVKIKDLADRNKSSNNRNFPLDESLDFNRIPSQKLFKGVGSFRTEDYSSVSIVMNPSQIEGKELGELIDSYDFVLRNGKYQYRDYDSSDVGKQSDLYFLEENDVIGQRVRHGENHLLYSWNSSQITNSVYKLINKDSVYVPSQRFNAFFDDFKNSHRIGEKRLVDVFFPILFSLKGFDVVHVFGLNPFKFQSRLENLIFSMHFKGYISFKDIYE